MPLKNHAGTSEASEENLLWYCHPAVEWNEALPIGNGRLGAMVFGGIAQERLQINEDSIWHGLPRDRCNPDALPAVPVIRKLLADGYIPEAERLAMLALSGVPEHPSHYSLAGDLFIELDDHEGTLAEYRRELDLDAAVCRIFYSQGGAKYCREYISSAADQVIVCHMSTDNPSGMSGRIRLCRDRFSTRVGHDGDSNLWLEAGSLEGDGVAFTMFAQVKTQGGKTKAFGQFVSFEQAQEITITISIATSFRHADHRAMAVSYLEAVSVLSWDDILNRHMCEHRFYFRRCDLNFKSSSERSLTSRSLPTDVRLAALTENGDDVGLVELYFHYGRYLLLGCSRPESLPANLQGIWNEHFVPPWGSKYTININTEMNYWPAEKANLGECHLPLLDLLERMLPNGQRVAQKMYGCRGFVAHHNTDIWGDCAPVDLWMPATFWPMGAAWLCLHLWEHWQYSYNREFLNRAWPLMREAALFFLDFLVPLPDGRLVTSPSSSPENTYLLPNGQGGCLCFGPSMDSQILHALFIACIEASSILERDGELAKSFADTLARLPRPQIGQFGQLMEWPFDYEEQEPGHRHISHLFALYPGEQISLKNDIELAEACRTTLNKRLAMGGGHTGWSKAWIINLWARLGEGNTAWDNIIDLLRKSTLPNLFDNHPPFQIDGNFGGTAGILELLVRDTRGVIELLPALPSALSEGEARGLRAKGGFELDFAWRAGNLEWLNLKSFQGVSCTIGYGSKLAVTDESGQRIATNSPDVYLTSFSTQKGFSYHLVPTDS
ncbi:MAG TPA: glycoside hydrolase family 95 protein [Treponemataceae bacterium]|nr:glycoside hydrolase family 95 protein [Treponemataceae bacterium]